MNCASATPSAAHAAPATQADTSELYYAHMEADRNAAEEAYFAARPQADGLYSRQLFRAGFERAYQKLWPAVIRGGTAP